MKTRLQICSSKKEKKNVVLWERRNSITKNCKTFKSDQKQQVYKKLKTLSYTHLYICIVSTNSSRIL